MKTLKESIKMNFYKYGNYNIMNILWTMLRILNHIKYRKGTKIISGSNIIKIRKDFIGFNNLIKIGPDCIIHNLKIKIHGSNNTVEIGSDVYIGEDCSFWIEGNNCRIYIGNHTQMTCICHLCAQEDNQSIIIGDDCMLSNNIIIRTSDSHPIYDSITNIRTNKPQSINIGNHVWIAPNSKIMKGSTIGNGSIIGSDSTVNKTIPSNVLAVGRPSNIIKNNIFWTKERLF